MNITPSDVQADALSQILTWFKGAGEVRAQQEFYLAGFAGTGKSTLAAMLLQELDIKAVTATYTGKAAHVLRQKGVSASTIHSLIYKPVPGSDPIRFMLAGEDVLEGVDLLILDEVSMVSEEIADDLRSFHVPMLVMGDPGQLPPISGLGAFTSREPDVFLREIHRQAAESPILRLATAARSGRHISLGNYDGMRVTEYSRRLLLDSGDQVICGTHQNRWKLTAVIRDMWRLEGEYPLIGEPVICCRNDRRSGLFNGMIGELTSDAVDVEDLLSFSVNLDGSERRITASPALFREHQTREQAPQDPWNPGIQQFDWAHVITCHKAQGSEWPGVVVIDDSRTFGANRYRWLYTAITRASERLTILRIP